MGWAVSKEQAIVDVGAVGRRWSITGRSLVERGHRPRTAIDLSATALARVRGRIGDAGKQVVLGVADVLDFLPVNSSPSGTSAPCSTS